MDAAVPFLRSWAPRRLCLDCLARSIDVDTTGLSQHLQQLERDGSVTAIEGRCMNCEERLVTYSIG